MQWLCDPPDGPRGAANWVCLRLETVIANRLQVIVEYLSVIREKLLLICKMTAIPVGGKGQYLNVRPL
jgi:hypothetical protein